MELEDILRTRRKDTSVEIEDVETEGRNEEKSLEKVAPKDNGVLDMVIAFDNRFDGSLY